MRSNSACPGPRSTSCGGLRRTRRPHRRRSPWPGCLGRSLNQDLDSIHVQVSPAEVQELEASDAGIKTHSGRIDEVQMRIVGRSIWSSQSNIKSPVQLRLRKRLVDRMTANGRRRCQAKSPLAAVGRASAMRAELKTRSVKTDASPTLCGRRSRITIADSRIRLPRRGDRSTARRWRFTLRSRCRRR
jgi:hypothetical protein